MDSNRDRRQSFIHELVTWLSAPAPSLKTIAEVADIIEEHGNVEHLRCLAFAFRSAAAFDADFMSSLLKLLFCSKRLGETAAPGSNCYAIRAYREAEEILSGADSREEHRCDPEDLGRMLLSHVRVPFDSWDSVEVLVKRLHDPPFFKLLEDESIPSYEVVRQIVKAIIEETRRSDFRRLPGPKSSE